MTTHMQTRLHTHTHTQTPPDDNNINKSKHVPHSLTRRRMLTTAQRMQQAERPSRARRAQERTATWLAAQKREQNITVEEREIGSGRDRERESAQELAVPVYLNAGDKSQASLSLSLLSHLPLLLRPTTLPLALRVAFMASFKINHSCKSNKKNERKSRSRSKEETQTKSTTPNEIQLEGNSRKV